MEEIFKLSTMVRELRRIKEMNEEEMIHYRNSIMVTLLAHTCKDKDEMMDSMLYLVKHLFETR